MSQLALLPYQNPLTARLGEKFFRELPQAPGVYLMYGLAGALLYVGKAKNLRVRLGSYRLAKPHKTSRKTIRLIHVVDEIRFEVCETEEKALLRENELLRLHKPSFNVVNKSPESYYFIGIRELERKGGRSLLLKLTTHPETTPGWVPESLFGAFKGRHSVREAYQTLLRLFWAAHCGEPRFEYPGCLTGRRVPYEYQIDLPCDAPATREWCALVRRYLKGTSDELLQRLTDVLLENASIPPFFYRSIQDDLERLRAFYEYGPRRHRALRTELGLRTHLIGQTDIDDLVVKYKAIKKLRF